MHEQPASFGTVTRLPWFDYSQRDVGESGKVRLDQAVRPSFFARQLTLPSKRTNVEQTIFQGDSVDGPGQPAYPYCRIAPLVGAGGRKRPCDVGGVAVRRDRDRSAFAGWRPRARPPP